MFCTSCGTKNATDSNFCKQCGGKLDRATAAKISADEFERALPEDEQVSALLERAYRLRKENNVEGAIALCHEMLRLRADSTSAHSLLGQLHEQKGDHEAAIREYERVLQLNPGSIADRVKLDELRGQDSGDTSGKGHTRVVMADPQMPPGLGYARFTSVGVGLALLVLCGLVVLQFRPRPVPSESLTSDTTTKHPAVASMTSGMPTTSGATNTVTSQSLTQPTAPTTPTFATTGNNAANGDNTTTAASKIASAAQTAQGTAALTTMPAPNTTTANRAAAPSPTIIYRPIYVPTPAAPASNLVAASRLPGIKHSKTGANAPSVDNDNGGHVVLPGDTDVIESNGKITVEVRHADVPGKKDNSDRQAGSSDEGGGSFSRVDVDKTPSGNARVGSAPAPPTSTESRSFLALGDEKKRQRDFKGAIDAFTKALASAGDQMGYVYQQRALCYQQLNELSSAKTDYERAINEYRKLETHDPETARNGVRACEKGIKTCGS